MAINAYTKKNLQGDSAGANGNKLTNGSKVGATMGAIYGMEKAPAYNGTAGAVTGAILGAVPQTGAGRVVDDLTYKEPVQDTSRAASYYDPSSLYGDAYAARQAALQQNYDMARNQLQKTYDDTVGNLRTQGEDALRQAYITMMMNKRGLGQSLEAQGLRGGATESALAGLYNNYANNRNDIARAVEEGLVSAGNTYGNNLANLGMQYNTNSADAMSDYQNQLANARMSLANTLAKTTANSKGTASDVIVSTLKSFAKSPVSARRYLNSIGVTGTAADNYLWSAGIDPANTYENAQQDTGLNADYVNVLKGFKNDPISARAYGDSVGGLSDDYYWAAGINPNYSLTSDVQNSIVDQLKAAGAEARNHNASYEDQAVNELMQQIVAQYGISEAEARMLLARAGY